MRQGDQASNPEPIAAGTETGPVWHIYLLRCRDGSL
jgi:hypothetical protein